MESVHAETNDLKNYKFYTYVFPNTLQKETTVQIPSTLSSLDTDTAILPSTDLTMEVTTDGQVGRTWTVQNSKPRITQKVGQVNRSHRHYQTHDIQKKKGLYSHYP